MALVRRWKQLLNGFGIRSWEQLAAFTKADIATVDAALEDFPGRIERDEWVPQARDFIKNGHKPVERDRKDRSGRTILTEWAKGTTKLGTPGAGHTDDLKVVNGIGPKMESVLASFGITSWEQLAAFTKDDVAKVTEALDTFPGRIDRDEWVSQAKDLVKRFRLTDPSGVTKAPPGRLGHMENTTTDLETAKAKLAKVQLTEGEASALAGWLDEGEVSGFSAGQPQGLFSLMGTMVTTHPGRPTNRIHDIEMERVAPDGIIEMTPFD
ncbi:50S ribosomal protein L21 [Nymphon striatum]|nr:50S ribosomal protein L21 [Nymphon striatum]